MKYSVFGGIACCLLFQLLSEPCAAEERKQLPAKAQGFWLVETELKLLRDGKEVRSNGSVFLVVLDQRIITLGVAGGGLRVLNSWQVKTQSQADESRILLLSLSKHGQSSRMTLELKEDGKLELSLYLKPPKVKEFNVNGQIIKISADKIPKRLTHIATPAKASDWGTVVRFGLRAGGSVTKDEELSEFLSEWLEAEKESSASKKQPDEPTR